MHAEKLYTTSEGEEVSIEMMIRKEPEWAASTIQSMETQVSALKIESLRLSALVNQLRKVIGQGNG